MDCATHGAVSEGEFHKVLQEFRNESKSIDYSAVQQILQSIFNELSTSTDRECIAAQFIKDLDFFLRESVQTVTMDTDSAGVDCVTNCFRILRNSCAMCSENQTMIQDQSQIIEYTGFLLDNIFSSPSPVMHDRLLVLARCAVQFLGNFTVNNTRNQGHIWNNFQTHFRRLLQKGDEKLTQYCCMVLHTLLSSPARDQVLLDQGSGQLLTAVVKLCVASDCPWGMFVIEDALQFPTFCDVMEGKLSLQERLLVLEVLLNSLKNLKEGSTDDRIPAAEILQHTANSFKEHASHVLLVTMETEEIKEKVTPLCIVKELECLCLASANHNHYSMLQEDMDLLTCAISILESMNRLGSHGDNVFSTVEKMADACRVDQDHPVYGLKKDLIRLVGNMAYRHKTNQDQVRRAGGIPLILNQTSIDGRNPFITQWSVFAIHNLCENNEENQQCIAALKLEGLANNQAVLEDVGLTAQMDGSGRVVLKKQKR